MDSAERLLDAIFQFGRHSDMCKLERAVVGVTDVAGRLVTEGDLARIDPDGAGWTVGLFEFSFERVREVDVENKVVQLDYAMARMPTLAEQLPREIARLLPDADKSIEDIAEYFLPGLSIRTLIFFVNEMGGIASGSVGCMVPATGALKTYRLSGNEHGLEDVVEMDVWQDEEFHSQQRRYYDEVLFVVRDNKIIHADKTN